MAAPRVIFDRVSKKFRRGERHDSLRDLIPSLVRGLSRRSRETLADDRDFWAVEDVSFEVGPGEALGIIGPNGAGKSTILKLLTKILRPTLGVSQVHGRVGALIEIAAGFHPDLTGRENVFLQGAIMGMKRHEIARRLDEIVEFAGISDFIDTPVKRYSSGMNARLGFSIAAHLDPDVLIIDEVLSVGDMAFQERCVTRLAHFKRQGVAIVFVSHNLQAVAELCDRALFVRQTAQAAGTPSDVIERYVQSLGSAGHGRTDSAVDIRSTHLEPGGAGSVAPGTRLGLTIDGLSKTDTLDVTIGLIVRRTSDSLVVYDGNFSAAEVGLRLRRGETFGLRIEFVANLTRGHYYVDLHLYDNPRQAFLVRVMPACTFVVAEQRTYRGVADLAASIEVAPPSAAELVGGELRA